MDINKGENDENMGRSGDLRQEKEAALQKQLTSIQNSLQDSIENNFHPEQSRQMHGASSEHRHSSSSGHRHSGSGEHRHSSSGEHSSSESDSKPKKPRRSRAATRRLHHRMQIIGFSVAAALALLLIALLIASPQRKSAGKDILAIQVTDHESDYTLSPDALNLSRVQGQFRNADGQVKQINAQGAPLTSLLSGYYEKVTVTGKDGSEAVLDADTVREAYLIRYEDGSLRLVVFDENVSGCDIRDVASIVIQ